MKKKENKTTNDNGGTVKIDRIFFFNDWVNRPRREHFPDRLLTKDKTGMASKISG